ncbi:agmatine deiminase family protein [Demequina capsici]|uniref:Agmatine deiminase family protein n=1 Tax=Demequina capsici TaxID=3075620 RepID=A0AA96J9H1_9MICO|nr:MULTISPECIES: agmatine deiminase family protein [unclassified Demequina]WNM24452.1 agmatine deiminase family protein [Demequina sp. OYTSA14]WNM27282.1 agmatine deiminase family protein [Demequina sp. PMTSA13]
MIWTMPAEWEPHERAWMAWPSAAYTLGDRAHEAWATWAAVANAIVRFEPVTMVVPAHLKDVATRYLLPEVDTIEGALDDGWYRDIGPTFVRGTSGLGAVNWQFNGWGGQDWASWEHDAEASLIATGASGATAVDSPLVNEGGGIHTDGQGTFLVTRTVQLDPGRNPGLTEQDVEAELARTVGARKVIWLPRGLTRDSDRFGTRGHVDIVACFTAPGRVLIHDQQDPAHPDFEVSRLIRATLEAQTDADGRALQVVSLPAPTVLRDEEGWVDYSYVNHFVINGAVILCAFDDPHDAVAQDILAAEYPGREIVMVDARPLFARGGGIHCITQQQPAI